MKTKKKETKMFLWRRKDRRWKGLKNENKKSHGSKCFGKNIIISFFFSKGEGDWDVIRWMREMKRLSIFIFFLLSLATTKN